MTIKNSRYYNNYVRVVGLIYKKYITRPSLKALGRLSQFASYSVQLLFDIYNQQLKITSKKLMT